MKRLKNTLLFLFMVSAIVCTSCSSDGEDGMDGEQGIPGQDGQDGNANVVSVLLENQTINNGDTVFDIPQLTQEIYDTGIVYAYVTVTGNDYWEVLPLSLSQDIILEIDRIEVGRITLRATFTQSDLRLRFILIEGMDANAVNFDNYEEVAAYYNIE